MDQRPSSRRFGHEEARLFAHCLAAASRALSSLERVESLLPYLECFPLGAFNRHVAQRIEDTLFSHALTPRERDSLFQRLRELRDPFMPAIEEFMA